MRQCGECSLYCKLIEITEIGKPARQWCPDWNKDKGCTIYNNRPEVCRDFSCLWLAGKLPDRLSPRKTRVVAMQDSQGRVTLFSDLKVDPIGAFARDIAMMCKRVA